MSDSLFLSKIQALANGLPVKPSTETHLPLDIHLQRMIATPVEQEILYHVEEGELVALNLAHSNLKDKGLTVLAEFSSLRSLNLTELRLLAGIYLLPWTNWNTSTWHVASS